MRLFIGDTETTGLGPTRKALEVALAEIDWEFNVIGEAEAMLNPECDISPEASAIHGIYAHDVAHCPTIEQWVQSTFDGKIEGECCLIGYRVAFDKPMLESVLDNIVRIYDVLPLAQTLLPELPNHKLQTIREHLNLPGGPAHRAMGDVLTTLQAMQVLIPRSGRTLQNHIMADFVMIHRMPWGKHKGCLLMELPSSYKRWLLEECSDLEPNLRRSVEIVYQTDFVINVPRRKTF